VWVTLAAVVAGTLIAMLLRRSDRLNPAQVAPGTVKTADQVRIEEIFKADGNLASDAALDKDYQAINAQYFEGRLPAVKLRWESRLDEVGPLIADGFQMSGVTDGRLILLNPAIQTNPDEVRRILCHEVVHIAVVGEKEPHGPAFQQYLRQLAARGAFKGIVATEAEKQEKRRAIDRRFADLAAEADILAKTKAEIDAASATVDTRTGELKERSDAYNDRVRRHNDAVAELNRSIDDYNLMVTYPDGLDRERLSRRSSVTPIG
jgi:predicted SprT family Zn-dependent metalloprotease